MDGMAVTARLNLRNKVDRRCVGSSGLRIGSFIAGANDNCDLLNFSRKRLFDQDTEQRFLVAVSIDKSLKRQCALRPRGGGNNSFLD
jgi:hypothetical protein